MESIKIFFVMIWLLVKIILGPIFDSLGKYSNWIWLRGKFNRLMYPKCIFADSHCDGIIDGDGKWLAFLIATQFWIWLFVITHIGLTEGLWQYIPQG